MTTHKIRRILVAVDFSSCSLAAFEFARDLAQELDATIDVLYVSPPKDGLEAGEEGVEAFAAARAEMRRFVAADGAGTTVRVREHVRAGDPREQIIGTAERQGFDVIVLGTHGRTGRPRMLAGSVAESVVRTASCPVITVRERPKSK